MNAPVQQVLREYEERATRESEFMHSNPEEFVQRVDDFLLSVGPSTGRMLHLLATGMKAERILEVGASYGYSTIWLADAARTTGGRVHSLELKSYKVDYAREQLARAGLAEYVEFHVGSALDTLPRLSGPFDFILLDLWKNLYCPCFELIYERLAPGALIAADNMLFPENTRGQAIEYQALVRTKPDMDSVLLPVGSGVELSRKIPSGLDS